MIKKYIKKPLVIIIIFLACSILLTILMYRAFCTLTQTIDWNAINAIASIAMAIVTVIAVYIAIYVPQEDRITASKIELFDKRFEAYFVLSRSFSQIYINGKATLGNIDIEKTIKQCSFIISHDDFIKIQAIYKSVGEKIKNKPNIVINQEIPDIEIRQELIDLSKIFEKYLEVREYGLKK